MRPLNGATKAMRAFVCTILFLAAQQIAAAPPAWQCGVQTDYYAKVTTVCAPASCNAAQRNLGGDIMVLDTKSYGTKSCQGCNLDIPATCCETCQQTNGCNAWVVCTSKDGCGSGCQAYAKQFKGPVEYDSPLPHRFWGNWGGCNGDKWPFGMCSLKVIKDIKNPPITSSKAADGWVSGIVPKAAADPRCPAAMSAKTCKACLGTKDPSKCISCVQATNTLDAADKCVTCTSLATTSSQDMCIRCVSSPNNFDCRQCLDVDCQDVDCLNAQRASRAKAPNLASVDKCFACQVAVEQASKAGGKAVRFTEGSTGTELNAKAGACYKCFEAFNVPKSNRDACIAGVTQPGISAAVAAGFPGCYAAGVGDAAKCLACAKQANTAADGAGCGSCSVTSNVPASFTAACHKCVLTAVDDQAKSYCSNLDQHTNQAAVSMLYKCLSTAKGPDRPSSCWQCYRSGDNASAAKCFECLVKVSAANGIHCSHCWVPVRLASKTSDKCESCLIGKDQAKQYGGDCWS